MNILIQVFSVDKDCLFSVLLSLVFKILKIIQFYFLIFSPSVTVAICILVCKSLLVFFKC